VFIITFKTILNDNVG